MLSNTTLKMIGIIHDKKGKYLFPVTKKNFAYIVPEKKLYMFFLFTYRYTFVIIAAFILYTLKLEYWQIAFIAAIFLVLLEWFYRNRLLGKFQRLDNFSILSSRTKNKSKTPLVYVQIVLYAILIVTFMYLGLTKYAGKSEQILYIAGACLSLFLAYKLIRRNQ